MKKIIAMLLLAACLLGLSGCHLATPLQSFEIPEEFDTSRTYEIVFWTKHESNINQKNVYEQVVADFEALYPNIKVKLQHYTKYPDIYNDVLTNIQTGTTPNVCITYPDHIATYLTGENTVVPLDALMEDSHYGLGGSQLRFDGVTRKEIIPQFLEECIVNDHYYAMPYMRSTEVCYINKDLVEKLGYQVPDVLTWEFVWEVSEAAMALGKDANGNYLANGQSTFIPFLYKSTDNMMIQLLAQSGAGYSTENGRVEIFNDTTRELLKEISGHAQTRAFSTFAISSYPANFLNAGQCIFAVDSTAGATWMGCDAPLVDIAEEKIVRFETVVRSVPQVDEKNVKMISQGPSVCIFNKEDSQEVLASWIFVQYLLTNEVQIAYSQTEGYVPVTAKAQRSGDYEDYLSRAGEDNDLYYKTKIDTAKLLLDNQKNTFVTPVFNGSANLRQAAGEMIEEVCKAARRKKTVDDAFIDGLYKDMTALYHLDEIQILPEDGDAIMETQQEGVDELSQPKETQAPGGKVVYGNKVAMDPLPIESVLLLVALGVTWVLIGGYCLVGYLKKRRKKD